ncbi:MAG TPA: hydrolase, partial [Pseudonocardiaceae bacterium]|nr:hydrolase [Pseudonocardiaceae bacterium]
MAGTLMVETGAAGGGAALYADLVAPDKVVGIVLVAHGSGSSRHSPRNRTVADALREHGLATLLLDLLTGEEAVVDERTGEHRFDVDLLGGRLAGAMDWLAQKPGGDALLGAPLG